MSPESVLGWDLGGAHLKAVRLGHRGEIQWLEQLPCPLWQGLDHLRVAVTRVVPEPDPEILHAVTMTGELVDLFEDRATGVAGLIDVMAEQLEETTLRIYGGRRGFLDPAAARRTSTAVASANWLASATLAAREFDDCVLVDVGSTTTDIVVCAGGQVRATGDNDHARLTHGELVYTGVVRTPVAVLARQVPSRGRWCTLMTEQFATAADVYRLTGELPAHADLMATADGGGKTAADSARRLARMVGLDIVADGGSVSSLSEWRRLATYLKHRQLQQIGDALALACSRRDVASRTPLIGAGTGRFLVRTLAEQWGRPYVDFSTLFEHRCAGPLTAADCAPAVAVAGLARAIR